MVWTVTAVGVGRPLSSAGARDGPTPLACSGGCGPMSRSRIRGGEWTASNLHENCDMRFQEVCGSGRFWTVLHGSARFRLRLSRGFFMCESCLTRTNKRWSEGSGRFSCFGSPTFWTERSAPPRFWAQSSSSVSFTKSGFGFESGCWTDVRGGGCH